jgi:hypothetical protein
MVDDEDLDDLVQVYKAVEAGGRKDIAMDVVREAAGGIVMREADTDFPTLQQASPDLASIIAAEALSF